MAQKFNIPSDVTRKTRITLDRDNSRSYFSKSHLRAIGILNVLPHTCFERENGEARAVFARGKEKLSSYASAFRRGVEKSLKPSSGWFRLVRDAGEAGIRGEDCEVLYRGCDEQQVPSKDTVAIDWNLRRWLRSFRFGNKFARSCVLFIYPVVEYFFFVCVLFSWRRIDFGKITNYRFGERKI